VLHWCSEYVIPKEGPGTARDEGGTAGADAGVKYKDDPNWWTHFLLRDGYGKDKHWVLLRLPSPEP
jgi:hypothetical protein